MSNFGKNIRKIRTFKNLSQSAFAEIFGITRASVGAYEEGRAEPKTESIIEIANYFQVSVDELLKKELTINDISKFNQKENYLNKPVMQENSIANIFISLVSISNYKEYASHIGDNQFLANLPQLALPTGYKEIGRAFEHNGIEMLIHQHGIYHGDILFCSAIKNLQSAQLILNQIYTVISMDRIFTRRLTSIGNILVFSADNSGFPDLEIRLADIVELWLVSGRFSRFLPQPLNFENRISDLESKLNLLNSLVTPKV
jgi:transcriptional regulator with XRE-family HTH domain